jgi:hypothetical protein
MSRSGFPTPPDTFDLIHFAGTVQHFSNSSVFDADAIHPIGRQAPPGRLLSRIDKNYNSG